MWIVLSLLLPLLIWKEAVMSKKKVSDPIAKAVAAANVKAPVKKATARKAKTKAPMDSQLKTTVLSAPHTLSLKARSTSEAANSFMRTTAFTLQNRIRTAMTGLSKIEKPSKTPSARLGLNHDSTMMPNSKDAWLSKPANRFKIAFLAVIMIGAICGYMYSDRVMDGFKMVSSAVTGGEKSPVNGDHNPGAPAHPRMMEENVLPVANEAPAAAPSPTDVLPTETPAAVAAPKAVETPKAVKPAKPATKAAKKGKAGKAKAAKAKNKKKAAH